MKKTFLILTVLVLFVAISNLALAKGFSIEDRVKQLTEQLDLTDDQVQQINDIYDDSEVPELMEQLESAEDRELRREVMTQMRSEMEKVDESK